MNVAILQERLKKLRKEQGASHPHREQPFLELEIPQAPEEESTTPKEEPSRVIIIDI